MRTGGDYRQALRDGRRVWVVGDGLIEDVTLHPATRPMVDEYVAWYDRHFDPAWADTLLTPPDGSGNRVPWAFALPKTSADVIAIGDAIQRIIFLSAGLAIPVFTQESARRRGPQSCGSTRLSPAP